RYLDLTPRIVHAKALERALIDHPDVEEFDQQHAFGSVWRAHADALPQLKAHYDRLMAAATPDPDATPGGQSILPSDDAFRRGAGWGSLEFLPDDRCYRWTEGAPQRVAWPGPEKPGAYTVRAIFWRPQPRPTEAVEVRYRVGDGPWRTIDAAVGSVVLEEQLTVDEPGQVLTLEISMPTWRP